MKTQLFIFITCLGQLLFAQGRFIIRPIMENKFESCSYDIKPLKNTGVYSFEKRVLTVPVTFSPLNIGIQGEYKIRKDWRIATGIAQDVAGYGYDVYLKTMGVNTQTGDTMVYDNSFGSYSSVATTRIPVILYKTFYGSDSSGLGMDWEWMLGVNFIYQPPGDPTRPLTSFGADSIWIYPNQYMNYNSYMFASGQNSVSFTMGLSTDIRYKKNNLFSLALYFSQGTRYLAYEDLRITIENQTFMHNIISRGSGLYVQLSRKFNVVGTSKSKLK